MAEEGKLNPVVGRKEIEKSSQIPSRSNNPSLIENQVWWKSAP
jgi:hypothetical protein